MGKHRDLTERLKHAESMVERNAKAMERHDKRAKNCRGRGAYEDAQQACNHYDRAARLKRKWQREVRKLQGQIQTREALAKRAPRLEDAGPEVISEKQQRKRDAKIEERRKSMAAAGLDYDHRTAAGRRHVDLANMGKNLRASINHMNSCLRKKSERTDARVVAWSMFDRHCHKVNAGLIASPRYEPGVDTSTIPGVSDSRLDALKADAELREFPGPGYARALGRGGLSPARLP